ncbi:hypothetical protein FPANT_11187 [Fusarium pseudoanthophilum]|uniref:Uncharacterized protein n=1 Tax=Fusarium pseudoanthophilum TaxID=48495 RepID=A0A8H5NR82_9HYPO|nr:hypothetical protein FPANT_11187 [Fusarium pseudoanthophilum]
MFLRRYRPPTEKKHQQLAPQVKFNTSVSLDQLQTLDSAKTNQDSTTLKRSSLPRGLGGNPIERRRRPPLKPSVTIASPSLMCSKFGFTREQRANSNGPLAIQDASVQATETGIPQRSRFPRHLSSI